jgi:hypothetical protein
MVYLDSSLASCSLSLLTVATAIKGKGDAQGDVEQQYPWFFLHYELDELVEPPGDAPFSSKCLYYYDVFAYYLNTL